MPETIRKHQKQTASSKGSRREKRASSTRIIGIAIAGAILGASAPGLDQWYLAWFGLVPLLLLTVSSKNFIEAFFIGLSFGFAYNLVYLHWYLNLHPLDWLGFPLWQSLMLAIACWIVVSLHQGFITGLFAALSKTLPLAGSFLPCKIEQRLCLPALIILPLLWVIIHNKVGNAHHLLGVPWSMLEYSQYRHLPILQATRIIGGIGLSFLIVMVNVAIAGLIATLSQKLSLKALAAPTSGLAITQILCIGLILTCTVIYGLTSLNSTNEMRQTSVSILQGNINIEMQKTSHRYTLAELVKHYLPLVEKCPKGFCIWTESALPAYLKEEPQLLEQLVSSCKTKHLDMVIGSLDRDFDKRPYNSAFGIGSDGTLLSAIYHKRYLVPFGEYTPTFVKYLPAWLQCLTNTPAGCGFNAGKFPVVLNFSGKILAPLICFETLSPELVVASVRNGGMLLINISDLAWFHNSTIGKQMAAFSVLRAVETKRYFVFAANTGPSLIIDPFGKVTASSIAGRQTVLTGKVNFSTEPTIFTQWFH